MADGLDPRAQRQVLEAVAGEQQSVEDLLRPAVVSPFVLKRRDVKPSEPDAPAHGLDLWFVAHGSLDTLAGKDFLDQWQAGRKDRQVHVFTPKELGTRKLREQVGEGRQERYGYAVFTLLERVEIAVALHAVTTRGPDSVLGAAEVDPRFAEDRDFPNRWRPIERDEDGRPVLGPAQAYGGAAGYLKITKLVEPADALFVEYHLVFTEPKGWFGGANLLRSKVPLLAQSEVRAFRRELAKAKK
jgi:hypothetical protein